MVIPVSEIWDHTPSELDMNFGAFLRSHLMNVHLNKKVRILKIFFLHYFENFKCYSPVIAALQVKWFLPTFFTFFIFSTYEVVIWLSFVYRVPAQTCFVERVPNSRQGSQILINFDKSNFQNTSLSFKPSLPPPVRLQLLGWWEGCSS